MAKDESKGRREGSDAQGGMMPDRKIDSPDQGAVGAEFPSRKWKAPAGTEGHGPQG